MLELGKASSSVYKNFIFKNVPVVKILQWKKLLIYSNFFKTYSTYFIWQNEIIYDQNFEINRWWLMSDIRFIQLPGRKKAKIFNWIVLGRGYRELLYLKSLFGNIGDFEDFGNY